MSVYLTRASSGDALCTRGLLTCSLPLGVFCERIVDRVVFSLVGLHWGVCVVTLHSFDQYLPKSNKYTLATSPG